MPSLPPLSYVQNNSLTGGLPATFGGQNGMPKLRFLFASNNPLGGECCWKAWKPPLRLPGTAHGVGYIGHICCLPSCCDFG